MSDTIIEPRLWGQWTERYFGSGTTIVTSDLPGRPHLYIFADSAISRSRFMADRYAMCEQIRDCLNGGERPTWIDDFGRTSEVTAKSICGGRIFATGPDFDADPPNLLWVQDNSQEAADDRARLMDVLFLHNET